VRVMLNVLCIQHVGQGGVKVGCGRLDCISFHDPEERGEYFMHALAVADGWVHLAPHKQDVQHHVLGGRLAEVDIVGHAPFNVLEDFGAQVFVGAKGDPWGLLTLSRRRPRWTCSGKRNRGSVYLSEVAQRIYRGLEFVGVVDCVEVVRA